VLVVFYDENRAPLGEAVVGPWHGTFPWQPESKRISVPQRTREAIVEIGLLGGLGEMSLDKVQLKVVNK
jgi:hypothetical protein